MIDTKYANILEATFLHIRGITQDKEKKLWDSGIINIEQLKTNYYGFQANLFDNYLEQTQETEAALNNNDIDFFLRNLPSRELYRAALTSYQDVIFLDIETTGLSRQYSYITLIGWVMNGKYKYYLKGQTPELLYQDLNKAKMIVTFNGSLFDLPFIKKEFPEAKIPEAHIDLRFFAKRFGYAGGQKKIEQLLKVKRPKKIKEVNGKEAIVLWYKYLAGDLESLELLFTYNFYDITGMQRILDKIVDINIINQMLPGFEKPLYKFSDQSIDFQFEATQEVYEQTRKSIKNYTLNELFSGSSRIKQIKAIGIDLTGSEEKPSGCCALENNIAYTCMLKSDQEIVDYVMDNKPMVVSIDSPLSLPHGRIKVTDDDEGRIEYGITRYCERALKKRGVNSYPCLIQSMQKLTARGIKLSDRLRSLGVPVIESFPGAAQDILRIPRKKTDLYFLKKGLMEFGIDIEKEHICHDELDAITSALVGLFFWQGKFEALGNEEEDYLIIPELDQVKDGWGTRRIIGFSGPIATGKTTAAMALKEKGYHYVRFSQILEEILSEQNIEINRNNLQELGNSINQEKGQYWLCKKLAAKITDYENVVIDGLRHPEDHAFFTEQYGPDFFHVFIDTDINIRRDRYLQKSEKNDEFLSAIEHPVEKNVQTMVNLAHLVVENNCEKAKFEDTILKAIENNFLGTV